jgi:hypothetical protein
MKAPTIHVWHDSEAKGWLWDDAEDHGGYDRCVPCGPFASEDDAERDALTVMCSTIDTGLHVERGCPPLHYPIPD